MRLSTKGRYAARIMVYLAMHAHSRPARKQDIAEAEDITPDYVEQILMRLKTSGLVKSHRGAKGGFSLGRDPAAITVGDVVSAAVGPIAVAPCLVGECERTPTCVTRHVWQAASDAMEAALGGTTIADLAGRATAMDARAGFDFSI